VFIKDDLMEDSVFKLPPGVLGSLPERSTEMSEDEVLAKLRNDPHFLVEVFGAACSSSEWLETNIKHFKCIVKIITDLSKKQKLTSAQENEIALICKEAFFAKKKTSEEDESLMPIESGPLSLNNASGFLLWAGADSYDELTASNTNFQKYLDYLSLIVLP
jgi:hypothetical protein